MIFLEDMMNVTREEVVTVRCNGKDIWIDDPYYEREDLCTYDDFISKYGTRVVKSVSPNFSDGLIVEIREV